MAEHESGAVQHQLTKNVGPDEKQPIEKVNEPHLTSESDKEDIETPVGGEPNEREKQTLRRIGERLPFRVFLVAVIELCERFTYYGCQGVFQNYVQKPPDNSLGRGGLGLGHSGATGLTTFYSFWCYVTPLLGGIVADQYLGKYKTLIASSGIYIAGLLILVCTSIPSSLRSGAGEGGYIASILLTGIGTGGIKANVAPLIAEQYTRRTMEISRSKKGERVIIDPYITIQHIYMMFYWSINIGALSLIGTTYMELDIGYWSGYTLCLCMFAVGTTILILGRKQYIDRPPSGTVVIDSFRAVAIMICHRDRDAPKSTWLCERGMPPSGRWDDAFVDEVKRTLVACKVFLIYPVFWLCYNQFSTNFVSQALQMASHGIPNDLMQNFDPAAIVVFVPIMDRIVYPFLLKMGIRFKPITRISSGFWVMSLAMMYAAVMQHVIYSKPPCYGHPNCDAAIVNGEAQGNDIHIAVQTPAYVLIGIAEIFAVATGYEYAYTKAPPRMKSFVQSLFLIMNAFGSAIGEAFLPALYDPAIMWMYVGLTLGSFLSGCVIWVFFHNLNDKEEEMNYIEHDITLDPNSNNGSGDHKA